MSFRALDRAFCQRLLDDFPDELLLDELLVEDVVDAFEAVDVDWPDGLVSGYERLSMGCVLSKHSFWYIMFGGLLWFVLCCALSVPLFCGQKENGVCAQ